MKEMDFNPIRKIGLKDGQKTCPIYLQKIRSRSISDD